jgi:pimeloyl-ACP methyl ester carboxylesterase
VGRVTTLTDVEFPLPRSGITLRGQRTGTAGGEPALCLHGLLDNSASFEPLLSELGDLDLDVVAVDLPGHGLSDPFPSATCQYFDMVAAVLELVDVLGWDRFHLIGHSLGGALSSLIAGTHPEKITSLVLIDAIGPLSATPERTRATVARYLHAYLAKDQNPLYRTRMQAVKARAQLADILFDTADRLVVRDLVPVPGGYSWRTEMRLKHPFMLVFTEEQVLEFLRSITAPTLLVRAVRTALVEDYYERRVATVPDLTQVHLAGGHHLHMENVEPVAHVIRNFLRERSADGRDQPVAARHRL